MAAADPPGRSRLPQPHWVVVQIRSPAATLPTPNTGMNQSWPATCPPRQPPVLFKYSQAGQPKSERASRETIRDLQISKPPAAIRATVPSAAARSSLSLLNLPSLAELSAASPGFFFARERRRTRGKKSVEFFFFFFCFPFSPPRAPCRALFRSDSPVAASVVYLRPWELSWLVWAAKISHSPLQ